MIRFFSGKPGSGKSLHTAKIIDTYLRRGKNVIANFDVNEDMIKDYRGNFSKSETENMTVRGLCSYALSNHVRDKHDNMIEGQTLVVIDECAYKFNSRSWNMKDRPAWANLFRQHRKFGYDFILVSQSFEDIDKQIRGLFLYDYNHRSVARFKLFGRVLSLLVGGFLSCVVVTNKDTRKKDHTEWFIGRKKYYRFYDSYKLFDTSDFV